MYTVRELYNDSLRDGYTPVCNVIKVCIHKNVLSWSDNSTKVTEFCKPQYTERFKEVGKEIGIVNWECES